MSQRVASSRRATKQARRKGAKSGRATTGARKAPPKTVELQKQLADALERQTASSEVLRIISSSPGELAPVFQAILKHAIRICEAKFGHLVLTDGGRFCVAAEANMPEELAEFFRRQGPFEPTPGSHLDRVRKTKRVSFTADDTAEAVRGAASRYGGARSIVAVPMLKNDALVGAILIYRQEVQPFTEKQIELLQTFADQAVIAIENVRLFDEVQAKTRDLTEALTYQTGSANILNVIASSPTDVQPVLKAIVESACELCGAYDALVRIKDGDGLAFGAHHGPLPVSLESVPITKNSTAGLAVIGGKPVHVHDLLSADGDRFPHSQELARMHGERTILSVPLLREGESVGAIVLRRVEVHSFSEKQIALLQTFADQAVIAIGNVRLFEEVQQRTRELSKSLDDLRAAQDRLIQTEKLASLGQLTAGIAHEIKNPLNFVNNFSGLSTELIGELQHTMSDLSIDPETRAEIKELTDMLQGNLEKIAQHGMRADAIVRSMLLHSGESSGKNQSTDINTLVDESLTRAYYNARAEQRGFTIKLERLFDPAAGEADLFPREIARVLLNLISNGFYAATKRNAEAKAKEGWHEPTLSAVTKDLGDRVEIRIRDNGTGVPADVKEKMFDPFFTTKPAGEGAGLGLSISHDIIVKQHGGRIDVETEPGVFTEFIITLPRETGATTG